MKFQEWEEDNLLDLLEESQEELSGDRLLRDLAFESLEQESSPSPLSLEEWMGLTVKLEILFGTKTLSLKELTNLSESSVITLEESLDSPVTLTINGKPFAQGEILAVDDHYGFRLTRFL